MIIAQITFKWEDILDLSSSLANRTQAPIQLYQSLREVRMVGFNFFKTDEIDNLNVPIRISINQVLRDKRMTYAVVMRVVHLYYLDS